MLLMVATAFLLSIIPMITVVIETQCMLLKVFGNTSVLWYMSVLEAQNKIQDNLGLSVFIQNKKNNSGKITIEYKNLEQFELISNLLKKN